MVSRKNKTQSTTIMFEAEHVFKQRLNFFKKRLPIAYDLRFYALLKRAAIAKIWSQMN